MTDWRDKAKALGVPLMKEPCGTGARKKEDVLRDIARLEPPEEPLELIPEHPKWEAGNLTEVESLMRRIEMLENTVNKIIKKGK